MGSEQERSGVRVGGSRHISIIGGSGFVGRAVVDEAVRRGHRVTVACRHPERARDLIVDGVRLVKADVIDGKGLDEAVAGADCVIYLVGLLFEKGRDTFEAAHVHGVEHAMAACKRSGIRRWLQMSALGAGSVPASRYACTKGEAETRVRQSGLDWTIFRPSVIYGANDSFFVRFKQMGRFAPVIPVIAGDTRFQPVWVQDVARAFVDAAERRRTIGQC
ncbi:MAG: NAD(P)H-binding protein, partial [Mariprofundaceae bacterium]